MGSGTYSLESRSVRATSLGYDTKDKEEIFKSRQINNAMSPHGIKVREAFDSEDHPQSLAIVLGLDVTGSMGTVPHFLVKDGLPNIMDRIIKGGVPDPALLFLGIGDHECDRSPLQVGQFESSDELLDKWLTDLWLEGGGGGNEGESYLLAWFFAAQHTSIDCFNKRKEKGFLFTIGDEPTLKSLPRNTLSKLMGEGQFEDYTADKLIEMASQKYNVYHIHIKETAAGSSQETIDGWKQLLHDNLIVADSKRDVAGIIADTVLSKGKGAIDLTRTQEEPKEEVML
jgi:hypothetical protein